MVVVVPLTYKFETFMISALSEIVWIFEDVMFSYTTKFDVDKLLFTTKFDVDELIWSIPQFLIFSANVSRHNIVVSRNVMVSWTLTSTLSIYNARWSGPTYSMSGSISPKEILNVSS